MKRVNGEFDVIVFGRRDCLAACHVSADGVRLRVKADPDDVEVREVVADVDVGGLGGRLAIGWGLLNEAADLAEFLCCAVRLHVLKIFEASRLAEARDLYVAGCVQEG